MAKVKFYRPDFVDETYLEYAVIAARFDGHWVFVRHKDRGTWEIPGGHREPGETALEAARRELWEETGALKADIMPVCVYQVNDDKYGMLFFAGITELGALPAEFEIREILLTDAMPEALTYPGIQPQLFEKVQAWRNLRSSPEEMWDVYDSRRKLTGRLHRRGELLEEGD